MHMARGAASLPGTHLIPSGLVSLVLPRTHLPCPVVERAGECPGAGHSPLLGEKWGRGHRPETPSVSSSEGREGKQCGVSLCKGCCPSPLE